MKYFALTGRGKSPSGIIRYDSKRESCQIWQDGRWKVDNSLFSFIMGDGGAQPITAAKAQEVTKDSKTKTKK